MKTKLLIVLLIFGLLLSFMSGCAERGQTTYKITKVAITDVWQEYYWEEGFFVNVDVEVTNQGDSYANCDFYVDSRKINEGESYQGDVIRKLQINLKQKIMPGKLYNLKYCCNTQNDVTEICDTYTHTGRKFPS